MQCIRDVMGIGVRAPSDPWGGGGGGHLIARNTSHNARKPEYYSNAVRTQKSQQEAFCQKGIVLRFRKDIQSEKGSWFDILCMRSLLYISSVLVAKTWAFRREGNSLVWATLT